MTNSKHSRIEIVTEKFLWNSRLIILLAVVFSMLSAFALIIAGSIMIWQAIYKFIIQDIAHPDYNYLLINIVGAVDLYLIGIVLLIFGFGIYELFVSKIDVARKDKEVNILEFTSLDGLKNKLLKVIIIVLVVYFFKSILSITADDPFELLLLGVSILLISASTFFIRQIDKEN